MSNPARVVPSTSGMTARHGSVVAHLAGCRTKAACPHDGSPDWLTCTEAAVAHRGDWRAAAYGFDAPIPRQRDDRPAPARHAVHGTNWGYRRGCRHPELCPNRYRDRPTCSDARRTYAQEYRRRRSTGDGTAIVHGTSNGYLLGCRGHDCSRGVGGASCREARAEYRRSRRESAGARQMVAADDVLPLVRALCDAGLSTREMARRTGAGRTTLAELLAGRRSRVTPEVAERLGALAIISRGVSGGGEG